jgi:hypothetical protein
VLVVERTVNARDDFEGKGIELVVLSAAHGNQPSFRHIVGPHHIFSALGADHCGASFEGDVRNIQDVVVMCVSDENNLRRGSGPTLLPGGAGPLIRERYGSIRIAVVPSEISHPAVPRYFRTT